MAKTDKVAEDWTAGGNEFQMTDAATGNERWPTVVRRYAGTLTGADPLATVTLTYSAVSVSAHIWAEYICMSTVVKYRSSIGRREVELQSSSGS